METYSRRGPNWDIIFRRAGLITSAMRSYQPKTLNIEMTTMDAEPKGSFLTMRSRIVRLLAELMQAHGILSLEAEVEPEDTARLVTMWNTTVKTLSSRVITGYRYFNS